MLHEGKEAEGRGQKELTLRFSVRQARHIWRRIFGYYTGRSNAGGKEAVAKGRNELTLRFSVKQARHIWRRIFGHYTGCSNAISSSYSCWISCRYHRSGYWRKWNVFGDHTYQIQHAGEGLLNKAVPHGKIGGFYVKHDDQIYQGQGILHELFGKIPLLNSLFQL